MRFSSVLLIVFLLFAAVMSAQTKRTVSAPEDVNPIDPGTQMMAENSALMQQLISGGTFNVKTAALDYEVDEEKYYLEVPMKLYKITLVNGDEQVLPARIQLLDQLVEVNYGGKPLQIDARQLRQVVTEDGRKFVVFRQPLETGKPLPLMEVLFEDDENKLYVHRTVEWRDPPQQKTSYDTGNYKRKMRREDVVYFRGRSGIARLKSMKSLLSDLPAPRREAARAYVKQQKLRNKEADYVNLLNYLRDND